MAVVWMDIEIEASGEAIAREFERYLKRRETDDG